MGPTGERLSLRPHLVSGAHVYFYSLSLNGLVARRPVTDVAKTRLRPQLDLRLKSSVCSPSVARRGSGSMMCGSRHSFLAERRHGRNGGIRR